MQFDPVIYSIPLFFTLIFIEVVYDWYLVNKKHKAGKYRLQDALSNIGCGVLDQISGVFSKVFTLGIYTLVFNWSQSVFAIKIPNNWFWYILFFVAVDFAYYLAHRWSHEVNFLWAGHVVHHQSEDYNLSVALRQGAFQKLLTFWVYLPLALLGFPPAWMLVAMGFNLLYQFWIHTEMIHKMGWFEKLFNTPSHHRVHHGKNPKYIDKNHAGVFIVWDKMLGTFQEEEERPTYGITVPTNTFNPVWSHFLPWVDFVQTIRGQKKWSNKMKAALKSPGWQPHDTLVQPPISAGFEKKKNHQKTLQKTKFNVELSKQEVAYIFIQFTVNMAVGAWFLNHLSHLSLVEKVLLFATTVYYLSTLGMLMDKKKSGFWWELTRHLFNIGLSLVFLLYYQNLEVAVLVFIFSLISLFWLAQLKKNHYA